jgi:hypothetical protein
VIDPNSARFAEASDHLHPYASSKKHAAAQRSSAQTACNIIPSLRLRHVINHGEVSA